MKDAEIKEALRKQDQAARDDAFAQMMANRPRLEGIRDSMYVWNEAIRWERARGLAEFNQNARDFQSSSIAIPYHNSGNDD